MKSKQKSECTLGEDSSVTFLGLWALPLPRPATGRATPRFPPVTYEWISRFTSSAHFYICVLLTHRAALVIGFSPICTALARKKKNADTQKVM